MEDNLTSKARAYLSELCEKYEDRSVGSIGNISATDFFAKKMEEFGYNVISDEFDCIDWRNGNSQLSVNGTEYEIYTGPYSLGGDFTAQLVAATTLNELKELDANGKILLLSGEIAREQLMPKNFVFYNPEEHREIIRTLENSGVIAIIAATGRNPELAGGVYPFPMIEDGDFNIPYAYMKDVEGERLASFIGNEIYLKIDSERIPSKGHNVTARRDGRREGTILFCAHIDSKKGAPGAIDNATGVVILLLLADLLQNIESDRQIEFVAFNGEDYYAAPGQMLYLSKYGDKVRDIELAVNMDGAGFHNGRTTYSVYNADMATEIKIRNAFDNYEGMIEGRQWIQSDHGIFVQMGIKAVAITSDMFMENLSATITHTKKDNTSIVDCSKLSEIAYALKSIINTME